MCISVVVKFFLLATSLLWGGAFFTQVSCFYFNFPSFPDRNNLLLSNSSNVFLGEAIQVTPDVGSLPITNKAGRAFYRKPFRLWKKRGINAVFSSTFTLHIQNQTATAGEGLAFVLTDNIHVPENSDGQWLSIVNATTNGTSQANIVAIEFDTRKSYSQDLDDNHVGLDINSIYSIEQVSLNSHGVYLSTGTIVTVQVQYDGKRITVFVGHNAENLDLVLSKPIDLSEYLPQKVFVGFTASTGIYTQTNCVKSWKFNGTNFDEGLKFWVWIVVAAAVVVVLLSGGVAFYFYRKKRNKAEDVEDTYPSIEDQIQSSTQAPRKFKLRKLIKATDKFNPKNQLGRGGFGTVYKGMWKNNLIAVKRVSETSRHGKQEFIAEVTTIGSLRHRNLVKLIGWCYENNDFLLVYEYMPNGSLDKFIFYDEKSGTGTGQSTLGWETRVSIIHGTALALDYLHNGCEKRVLHRDIKASNIMLDSEFKARLGDFGLARTIQESQKTHHSTKEIAGTPGYMAPEIFLTGRATVETDVYAFGVLILEVACGRQPGNQSEQNHYNNSIVHWIWELYRKGRIIAAADSRLEVKFSEEEMECVLILGLACCHPNPHLRPSMKVVLQVLSGEAPPPQVPIERPSFVWPAMPPSFYGSDYSLTGSQFTQFSDISAR
ncbi:hypothetical protein Dsin_007060 [Dipteronia sinensis]|uniref:Protein kinase domain-containing protein n=1 Tax=Dipteronia sinensis TaxID=43782 RepID=A0AAE0EG53_9ROSI|nr:hypothetical protein Dsin_007060 [Dipteronia sinensis]